ncbi:MAG TPA: AarF/UbiB family protein, partial [Candidatus Didemnitutus sp.]|nr:AarF/UbiB family protein [Candidatus Didemnitutus sp.]
MTAFNLIAHAGRAKDILSVLARHGFADLFNQAELPGTIWEKILPHPAENLRTEEHIRQAAEELGPTFVKLGQILSMRPDLLPHPVILELRKLQDDVPALPFADMRPVLVSELGREPEEIFDDFCTEPAACASLAQVYFAKLRSDGSAVAIKVQKPGIAHLVQIDLDLAFWLAEQLHRRVASLQPYQLPAAVTEAREGILH